MSPTKRDATYRYLEGFLLYNTETELQLQCDIFSCYCFITVDLTKMMKLLYGERADLPKN